MRQAAHDKGAHVQAVLLATKGSCCHVHGATADASVQAQLSECGTSIEPCGTCTQAETPQHAAGGNAIGSAQCAPHQQSEAAHLLALPAECNVTGLRPSDETLDALCDGRVHMHDSAGVLVRFCNNQSHQVWV